MSYSSMFVFAIFLAIYANVEGGIVHPRAIEGLSSKGSDMDVKDGIKGKVHDVTINVPAAMPQPEILDKFNSTMLANLGIEKDGGYGRVKRQTEFVPKESEFASDSAGNGRPKRQQTWPPWLQEGADGPNGGSAVHEMDGDEWTVFKLLELKKDHQLCMGMLNGILQNFKEDKNGGNENGWNFLVKMDSAKSMCKNSKKFISEPTKNDDDDSEMIKIAREKISADFERIETAVKELFESEE